MVSYSKLVTSVAFVTFIFWTVITAKNLVIYSYCNVVNVGAIMHFCENCAD